MEIGKYLLTPQASSTPFTARPYPTPDPRASSYTRLYSDSLHPVLNNRGKLSLVSSKKQQQINLSEVLICLFIHEAVVSFPPRNRAI